MSAKHNVPANSEVGPTVAMIGETRGGGKDKWDSDSGATFHIPHTYAGGAAYKKASSNTTVEVVDGKLCR